MLASGKHCSQTGVIFERARDRRRSAQLRLAQLSAICNRIGLGPLNGTPFSSNDETRNGGRPCCSLRYLQE